MLFWRLPLVILLVFAYGCGFGGIASLRTLPDETRRLKAALSAFHSRDYLQAEQLFRQLTDTAQNPDIADHSLFGLACTRLTLAENRAQYADGIVLWRQWTLSKPIMDGEPEDPRLLEPVLLRWGGAFESKAPPMGLTGDGSPTAVTEYRLALCPEASAAEPLGGCASFSSGGRMSTLPPPPPVTRKDDRMDAACKDTLETKDREVRHLRTTLKKLESDIRVLKNQILSLEAIHQKIQEKKKTFSQ